MTYYRQLHVKQSLIIRVIVSRNIIVWTDVRKLLLNYIHLSHPDQEKELDNQYIITISHPPTSTKVDKRPDADQSFNSLFNKYSLELVQVI